MPAVLARSATGTLGMEIRILVEGNGMERMQIAENVAAAAAMMTPGEIGEGTCARRLVADGDGGIGLQQDS